jgi:hypothetical protein
MYSHGRPKTGSPPAWVLGKGLTTPHHKKVTCNVMYWIYSSFDRTTERHKERKMDLRFVTWSRSIRTVAGELARYILHLLDVQEVRWDRGGTEQEEDFTLIYGQGNDNRHLGIVFCVRQRIRVVRALNRVQCISERMSCIELRGQRGCTCYWLTVNQWRWRITEGKLLLGTTAGVQTRS